MKRVEFTALTPFRIEEAKINEAVAEAETHCERVIREQEKIRDVKKAEREKAAGVLARMKADFEKIEGDLEGEERARLDAADLTKAALNEGRISAAAYFKQGLTAEEITAKAAKASAEKLVDLRDAIRTQATRVIELEAAEAEADFEVSFARTYPAVTMRERLAALLKALEASLNSPIGLGGTLAAKNTSDAKKRELRYAKDGRLPGEGSSIRIYDLAGLKRLRFDPLFPAAELGRLDQIILEAKTTGRTCGLSIDPRDRKNPIVLIWN